MPLKEAYFEGETVENAISKGLEAIGLEPHQVMIKIKQKDGYSVWGYKEALVTIIFDKEESECAIAEKAENEYKSHFKMLYEFGEIKVLIPSAFYDKHYLKTDEEKRNFLVEFLKEKDVLEPDLELIEKILKDFSYNNTYVTFKTFEYTPFNDDGGGIFLEFSEDRMECYATLFTGGNFGEEEVLNALKENLCIKGIMRKSIYKALKGEIQGRFLIARGKNPVDDSPGVIEKFFEEEEINAFKKMIEMLQVDTRNVKEINIADRNQLLLRIGNVIEGKDGYTVTGQRIPKKSIEESASSLNLGNNVYFSDTKKEVYSKKAGHISWDPVKRLIDIEPIYIVEGNVDFSEGNIMGFVGKVLIKGDVKPKFTVLAEGDIEIQGSVEDAVVKSLKGNVLVAGAIINKNDGYVQAKKFVKCSIATNAVIRGESIEIDKEVMNSHLEAKDYIKVLGTPGVIMGGVIEAKKFLQANTIGSENWVLTKVYVGDVSVLKEKRQKVSQQLRRSNSRLAEIKEIIEILSAKKKKLGKLDESQSGFLQNSLNEQPELERSIVVYEEELKELDKEILERRDAKLEVLNTVYPQVDIRLYKAEFTPQTPEPRTGFYCMEDHITRYTI